MRNASGSASVRKETPQADRAAATAADARWPAVVGRDASADGVFYYSVATTGVYCRPSCAAKLARPENVRFHASREEAERAGFRPCKRCRPDRASLAEEHASIVTAACRLIEGAVEDSRPAPSLAELARSVGVSPHHFHRTFKQVTGLTPRAYAAAQRERRLRAALQHGGSVTDSIFAAGYGSSGRFYAEASQVLGMTPRRYRAGGANADIRFAVGECSLGSILVARSDRGVCAISLGDDPDTLIRDLEARFPHANLLAPDESFERLVAAVIGFVESPGIGLELPLDVRGTAFQKRVWQALTEIPAGTTATYAEIAKRIGAPSATRAVAQACAANPVAVAIPCHRVVRTNGELSGYRWGVERKRALLAKEKRR